MKKHRRSGIGLLVGLLMLGGSVTVQAISLGFAPPVQNVISGQPVSVALVITDLGQLTPPSLSTFDLDLTFDPTLLAVRSVTFGDPQLGDQLDLLGLGSVTEATPGGPGRLNLFGLSLDDALTLHTLQAGDFTLATLTYDTLASGTSLLGLTVNALGDAFGDPLLAEVEPGRVIITAIPEPSTLLFLSTGLLGLLGYGWRQRQRAA
jgi:hypothetical protein